MLDLARKLQLKGAPVRVLYAPADLELDVRTSPDADAVLLFVRTRAELDERAEPALAAARANRLAWIAYPKGGQLETDLNRDRLSEALGGSGIRPVAQVAIDEVWSALRFRPG